MRRSIVSIAVALVVVTAGCGGLVGDDGRSDEAEPNDRGELALGFTASGVTDPGLLLAEHDSALEDAAYRTEWERTITDGTGVIRERDVGSRVVAAGGAPAYERVVKRGVDGTTTREFWVDRESSVVRRNESGSVTYLSGSRVSVEPTPPIPLEEAYEAVDSVTVDEEAGDRYVLEGTAEELGRYESVSFTLALAEEGYLTAYAFEGELADDSSLLGGRSFVEEAFALTPLAVPDADPAEPEWLEEGREAVSERTDG